MSTPISVRRPPLLVLLSALLFFECALLAATAVYLLLELLTARADSLATAIAILILTTLAAIWLGVIALNVLRGRSWTRAAAVTWQVLQIAIAIGSFQGAFAVPSIGWFLLAPAVAVLVLLFTPSVLAATRREEAAPPDDEFPSQPPS